MGGTINEYQARTDYHEGYKEGYNEAVRDTLERLVEMNKLIKEEAECFASQHLKNDLHRLDTDHFFFQIDYLFSSMKALTPPMSR